MKDPYKVGDAYSVPPKPKLIDSLNIHLDCIKECVDARLTELEDIPQSFWGNDYLAELDEVQKARSFLQSIIDERKVQDGE